MTFLLFPVIVFHICYDNSKTTELSRKKAEFAKNFACLCDCLKEGEGYGKIKLSIKDLNGERKNEHEKDFDRCRYAE